MKQVVSSHLMFGFLVGDITRQQVEEKGLSHHQVHEFLLQRNLSQTYSIVPHTPHLGIVQSMQLV
jgi:hypothetical protein